jgi:quinol monooxygenase YgiN
VEGKARELFIFGRFHARPGAQRELEEVIRAVIEPSRKEPGCLGLLWFRSTRDPRLFFVHSRWVDEAAFDRHASLPHTVRFIERAEQVIDHPLDVNQARLLAWDIGL